MHEIQIGQARFVQSGFQLYNHSDAVVDAAPVTSRSLRARSPTGQRGAGFLDVKHKKAARRRLCRCR